MTSHWETKINAMPKRNFNTQTNLPTTLYNSTLSKQSRII